ncbi:helix-turn-helix domain-containing protein [Dielma fastidiosa]|uniref:helix-turn-helix domain-containing protein n=1 Tax=Dielma fastidiosa TaxID=1034346 RepID=UPI000D7B8CF9|nr:helix-turn-helix domain-containing protein [Dielma fastidiosa]PWM53370.1 MAG: hypothetical protein DBX92_16160 [Dielma fastidiosa]
MDQNIGKEIRLIRKQRNLSLRALGDKIGVYFTQLGKIERGEESVSDEILLSLEKALEVNFNDILEQSRKIETFFEEFLNSLFFHDQNEEYFKTKIKSKQNISTPFNSLSKIQLMEYILLVSENKIDEAIKMEDSLFEYFIGDYECEALLYQYKGVGYFKKKDYDKALFLLEKARSLVYNEKQRAMILLHLYMVYFSKRMFLKAAVCIETAMRIFAEQGSLRRLSYCYVEYALLLKAEYQYEKAIEYFNKGLHAGELINWSEDIFARTYRNMYWTMILAKDYLKALDYLDEAIEIQPNDPHSALYEIWCNYKLKRYDDAEKIIFKNLHLYKDPDYSSYFKLFDLLVKCKDSIPSKGLLKAAKKTINSFKGKEEYERYVFYIDIILDLLERSDDQLSKIKYLEMKINLLQCCTMYRY